MVVGVNPVIQEVEAIAAPTVTTITLRSAWTGTGGTYSFLANQTSEGLRDAVQAIRSNNASLQSFIDSIDTAATADSVAQRDATGQLIATNLITADKIIHDGDTNTAIRFPAADTVTVETDGAERVRVTSTGNVGIGTNSPEAKQEIFSGALGGTSGDYIYALTLRNTNSNQSRLRVYERRNSSGADWSTASWRIQRYVDSSALAYIDFQGDNLVFGAGLGASSTERMRITSSGNVLVGKTADNITVAGLELRGLGEILFTRNGDMATFNRLTTDGDAVRFRKDNTTVGSISVTGSATAYNTSSDYRLKEDWQPMEGNIDRLMQLKPCNFAWKISGQRVDGFLAHEAQEVVPEAVHGTKDAVRTEQYEVSPAVYEDVVIPAEFDEEGNEISPERTEQQLVSEAVMGEREVPEYQGIDQSKIVPLLTAALQDAVKKIEALEARIEALEG
jgi:hypothetical protein